MLVGRVSNLTAVNDGSMDFSRAMVSVYSDMKPGSSAAAKKGPGIISKPFQTMEREGSGTSQGPLKTCKDDQKQVNSLLKAIRPRVYITDSSSFKKLVQELTGNGRHVISSPTRATPTNELHDHVPVISIEDYGEPEVFSLGEDSWEGMQPSIDSQDSSIQTLSPLPTFSALQTTWMTQQIDEFQYPEVDAWPVEIDSFSFDDVYSFQTDEEMLFSQYDLSELYSIL